MGTHLLRCRPSSHPQSPSLAHRFSIRLPPRSPQRQLQRVAHPSSQGQALRSIIIFVIARKFPHDAELAMTTASSLRNTSKPILRSKSVSSRYGRYTQRLIETMCFSKTKTRGYGRMTTTPRKPTFVFTPPFALLMDSTPAPVRFSDLPPRMNQGLPEMNELAFAPDHPEGSEGFFDMNTRVHDATTKPKRKALFY